MQTELAQFLASVAGARNITDLNIAAGIALEGLGLSRLPLINETVSDDEDATSSREAA